MPVAIKLVEFLAKLPGVDVYRILNGLRFVLRQAPHIQELPVFRGLLQPLTDIVHVKGREGLEGQAHGGPFRHSGGQEAGQVIQPDTDQVPGCLFRLAGV